MCLRSELSKARGLGSAKDGTGHWWHQRLTALVLIPTSLWFVYSLMNLATHGLRTDVITWMQNPVNAIALIVMLSALFYHAKLGLQTVIEDYVHQTCCKTTLLILNTLGMAVLGLASIIAVLKLHLM
jgi:succinate dehydrogenase / fumarate reductase membrane anchor subunit